MIHACLVVPASPGPNPRASFSAGASLIPRGRIMAALTGKDGKGVRMGAPGPGGLAYKGAGLSGSGPGAGLAEHPLRLGQRRGRADRSCLIEPLTRYCHSDRRHS